ncbi:MULTISPECIES: hypothetical protein [unclassified Streptomyces]|uniref:hypothetical protein n=1 Tax=unclassified Streptomyces TaxID=2593676 RepID=UPI00382CF134
MSTRRVVQMVGVALMAALALVMGSGATAFAAQPGEETYPHQQYENGAPLRHRGFTEARDLRDLVQVWRGFDNDNIWVSINNGAPMQWPGAQSHAAPQIVWTAYGFRVYHTGTDGHIYYAGLSTDAYGHITALGSWQQVPNNVVTPNDSPPAVTSLYHAGDVNSELDHGGESVYLAYRGANSTQIYGAFFYGVGSNRYPNNWHAPTAIPHATSEVAPSLSYHQSWNRIVMAWAGEDLHTWAASQIVGHSDWSAPEQIGTMQTVTRPALVLTDNGGGQIAVVPYANGWSGGTTELISIFRDTSRASGIGYALWTGEITGNNWSNLFLSAIEDEAYLNATDYRGLGYYKHTLTFNGSPQKRR